MECLFGIVGKDFVLMAADKSSIRSIVVMKSTEDKSRVLTPNCLMMYAGEAGDAVNFSEYVQRNVKYYGVKNQVQLSTRAAASFARKELANSLRSRNAYSVNLLIGGFEETNGPELYWIDYLAASASVPFAAHGYGAYFCLSLLDRFYKPDCTLEQAKALLKLCIQELKVRFVVNLPEFVVKVIDKQGISEIVL